MTLLYVVAAIFIVPSLAGVRRHPGWLTGACLGFGAGVAALAIARRTIAATDVDAIAGAQDARMATR